MPLAPVQSPLLSSIGGLVHAFDPGTPPLEVATAKQVHKSQCIWAERLEKREREADAIATKNPGLAVGIYSADCTPLLMAALAGDRPIAVMAVHAGWRGTALGVAREALQSFLHASATRYVAAIGPCIGFESFEVGEEVIAAFPHCLERGLARFLRHEDGKKKYLFDLRSENARQLREEASQAGVPLELELLPHCTFLERDRFPSYRRDREKAGRILSYIALRDAR